MSEDTSNLNAANPIAPGYQRTTGNSQGVDTSAPQGTYAARMMPIAPMTSGPMAGASNVPPLLQSQADLKS